MVKKGGKIVGLGPGGEELSVTDPSAVEWFDTNKYKTVSKEEALGRAGGRRTRRRGGVRGYKGITRTGTEVEVEDERAVNWLYRPTTTFVSKEEAEAPENEQRMMRAAAVKAAEEAANARRAAREAASRPGTKGPKAVAAAAGEDPAAAPGLSRGDGSLASDPGSQGGQGSRRRKTRKLRKMRKARRLTRKR